MIRIDPDGSVTFGDVTADWSRKVKTRVVVDLLSKVTSATTPEIQVALYGGGPKTPQLERYVIDATHQAILRARATVARTFGGAVVLKRVGRRRPARYHLHVKGCAVCRSGK